jgi:DNA helicase-2/ATP-dependent DNA helicase PcrA
LTKKLVLASAGAGKTQTIIDEAIARADDGQSVLILTYTENNQRELKHRLAQVAQSNPENIKVKGWFSFLLEDMIRPYQNSIIPNRIAGLNFTTTNPHKRDNFVIPGRAEIDLKGNTLNAKHFLTIDSNKAHSTFLAKLAIRICERVGSVRKVERKHYKIGLPLRRLEEIYDAIYIDEMQDLAGYDYEVIRLLSVARDTDVICVGDFRQTIYKTSHARPTPKSTKDKIEVFKSLGFDVVPMATSKRCIQKICEFSDLIHPNDGYNATASQVDECTICEHDRVHLGVFCVRTADILAYLDTFSPVILRHSINDNPSLCAGRAHHNFGASKGLGFPRVLILPTTAQRNFLAGVPGAFDQSKTDEARNKFYVAVTRARLSVAFLYDGKCNAPGITAWMP